MHKTFIFLAAILLIFCGCGRQEQVYWEQPVPQFSVTSEQSDLPDRIAAVWIPVMQYADWMAGRTEQEFRAAVREAFENIRDMGLNTVFLHMRAYQDAYYDSGLFPRGAYLTGDYDPLAVMIGEARDAGLSVHAWVNPLRGQTAEGLAQTDKNYILRQWYEDDEKNGTYLVSVDGRYWLNPAYPEVRQLIADGVSEILEHYDVDGIHIDDFFYPTTDAAFDAEAFAASGASDLGEFRRENSSALVKALYDTVKSHDPDKIFSISPQGNQRINYEEQFADTALWAGTPGYCDWILPQLYYGFENAACPFAETLAAWEQMASAVKLIPGLAPYKIGAEDKWAGSGADEWLTNPALLSEETELLLEDDAVSGAAYYSYAALFEPESAVSALVSDERERIRDLLKD